MSVQTYMGFALKAQTQCRVTVEAVERIRTSRPTAAAKPPRPPAPPAEESKNAANELLRRWLDVSARTADSEKSTNELLRAQLLGGVAVT